MPVGKGDDFLTAGIQILYDKAGTAGLTTTNFLPALNYHKSLNSNKTNLSFCWVYGRTGRKSIDRSKVTTNAQYDGVAFNPATGRRRNFFKP